MDRAMKAAEQWRGERPDIETGPMVVLGRLLEAAHRIAQERLNPLFAEYGLQPGEFDVLATLRRSGAPYELTPTALYDAAMISSGSMTNRIDRLEKAGLVKRRPHPTDRRGTLVALAPKGLDVIERAIGPHVRNQQMILSVLTKSEQEQLSNLLAKLITAERNPSSR
ncbi:MarR family winged helix-turn-helix transcriptional regulator [Archangium lipolyticum]|uniref:MarR family winged helix-turn-helix transcriptional regulator n=1 Tax=Archangium lipolyticum TaxID=2970465 RepID=UPI00214A2E25|nr:MarR family transcriptional regulator [Archangium lipolyticum]